MKRIDEIIKDFVDRIVVETKKELRNTYVQDVQQIVKEQLDKNQVYQGAGSGFLTIEAICEKYKVSRQMVSGKCAEFKVERKKVGKKNLVNEAQFLDACQNPSPKPAFLKK